MMGLRRLLREERELEEDADHYNYQINDCDDDSLETLESAREVDRKLLKVRQRIVNSMKSNLERREDWLRKHAKETK
jgi:hypothetical protein|tara:strand:+ start:17132 stop:17362 length:231 start_codon:yes stop_codon:yes gene_type:complete